MIRKMRILVDICNLQIIICLAHTTLPGEEELSDSGKQGYLQVNGYLQTYLITGGTGTLGSLLTRNLLSQGHKVRVFARNEHSHEKLAASLPAEQRERLTCCVGAVEDVSRLKRAVEGADILIHAAAQKVIPIAEFNPWSCIRTNVDGTINVAEACLDSGVSKAVLVSTDKARSPSTLYGASKLCAERAWLASNRYRGGRGGIFLACAYGNVFGSTGSVLPIWEKQRSEGKPITVTDGQMTRFHMRLEQAVELVLSVASWGEPETLSVPKLPSYRLCDLAEAYKRVFPDAKGPEITGRRPAEKLHEEMISETESSMILAESDDRYVLAPGKVLGKGGWSYNSGTNQFRLGIPALEKEIREWASS